MTPSEISALFALMREYKVSRFKQGDVDVAMELEIAPVAAASTQISDADAKFWSAAQPIPDEGEAKMPPTTT